jgi:ArsR family transcriptional regulator
MYIERLKEEIIVEKTLDIFKILSDETRLRILMLLNQKKLCVCELCGIMQEPQPKISKHLGKLRDMGIVKDVRQEQFMFYYICCKDQLFKSILKNITENIKNYPVLSGVITRAEDAEKYRMFLGQVKVQGKGIKVTLADGAYNPKDPNVTIILFMKCMFLKWLTNFIFLERLQ